MKKIAALILAGLFLLSLFSGCADKTLLDPRDPVTLTIWHVYGEQADAPMNLLIREFNDTVGKEKGIQIQVTNVTGTSKLLAQLQDSMANKPGTSEVPDLFSCHTQNAVTLGAEKLLDFSQWFTAKELAEYVPEFIESGKIDGKLAVFPVSKSTYALFISGGEFSRFSADTGVTYDSLSDWEGFFAAAEKYYTWSGGKPFCAFDYLIRHMELDVMSRTGKLDYTEGGWYDENDPVIRDSFLMFARALAQGHVVVSDLYANTQVMTGDVFSGIGSSAAVGYYNDVITYPDNTSEPMQLQVLPLPRSGGEKEYMPQTGVGLAAFATTEQKAEAAYEFVKWFTESERNLDFVTKTGYMPVTDGAFDAIEHYSFADEGYANLYRAIRTMHADYIPVVRPDFEGFYDKTNALYAGIREMQPGLVQRSKNGESAEALAEEIWALFCSIG
ncbi:MAG: carbohydrate ABC transporter substrate-binding protein [Clostridia bacterium]|nr:carbohydrate ABC transporter substrate-binding protein [Clostridia bacterium]